MADSNKRVIVDGVEFQRVWLFPRMLTAITSAMQPARMLIALFMVILLIAIGRMWDRYTEPSVNPAGLIQGRYEVWQGDGVHRRAMLTALAEFADGRLPPPDQVDSVSLDSREVMGWVREGYLTKRAAAADHQTRESLDGSYKIISELVETNRPRGDFEATVDHLIASFRIMVDGALDLQPRAVLHGADQFFVQTPSALWQHQTWFAVVYGLVFIGVFAIGGGAISRIAALQQSNDQRLPLNDATDFAVGRAGGLVASQLLPLILLGLLAVVVMVVGFFMRIAVIDVIVALFYGLVLLLGFLMAFLLVGYVIGFPMLVPAVACENGDGADAMQRTYAYVINRPLHALWYWAVGLFGLAIGFAIISALAIVTLNITGALFGELASGPAVDAAGGYQPGSFTHNAGGAGAGGAIGSWHERWSANIIVAWQSLVVCLVVAYVLSYHFSASTIGYLLMRKASDGQEMDEVWRSGLVPGTQAAEPRPMVRSDP